MVKHESKTIGLSSKSQGKIIRNYLKILIQNCWGQKSTQVMGISLLLTEGESFVVVWIPQQGITTETQIKTFDYESFEKQLTKVPIRAVWCLGEEPNHFFFFLNDMNN